MGRLGTEAAEKRAAEVDTSGKYLRLEDDGDKAIVAFIAEIYSYDAIWTGSGYLDADDDDGKKYLKENSKVTAGFRARVNTYVLERGHKDDKKLKPVGKVQIFENGLNWFNSWVKLRNKFGFTGEGAYVIELERNGSKGDTKTTYSQLPHDKIDDIKGLSAILKKCKPYDLADLSGDGDSDSSSSGGGSNGVISDDDKKALIADLKPMGREVLDEFMTEFGIGQLKALPSGKLDDAKAFIASKQGKGEEETKETDPFA